MPEKLLHWVQPRRVLSVEEHIHFELLSRLRHPLVLVHHWIFHDNHNISIDILGIGDNTFEQFEHKVLKHNRVDSTFYNLSSFDGFLTHSGYHCQLIILSIDQLFLRLKFHRKHSKLTITVFIIQSFTSNQRWFQHFVRVNLLFTQVLVDSVLRCIQLPIQLVHNVCKVQLMFEFIVVEILPLSQTDVKVIFDFPHSWLQSQMFKVVHEWSQS